MSEIALFIHSTGTGPFMWKQAMAQLPEGITGVAPLNRGYAPDDLLVRGTPFHVDDEVRHLKAQVPAGTEAVHLVGHSYGGLVALSLALQSELPVRSVWLYEPVLFAPLREEVHTLPADAQADVAGLFDPGNSMLDDATGGNEVWLERFVDYWNHPGMWASMSEKSRFMATMVGWKMFKEVCAVSTQAKAFEHYALPVPVTLARGEHTTGPAREMVRRLSEVNPHAEVEVLQGLGHMAVVSAPQDVALALQRHWQRVRG